MASITIWTRLEPHPSAPPDDQTRDALLSTGLQARVEDPLWLIGRQWQLGELRGEDAGSPVQAHLRVEGAPLTRFAPALAAAGKALAGQPYKGDAPLEALVEREPVRAATSPARLRFAVEAGLHLLRMLDAEGYPAARTAFLAAYAWKPAAPPDAPSARFTQVISGRVIDGIALRDKLRPLNPDGGAQKTVTLPPEITLAGADRDNAARVVGAWMAWYDKEAVSEPSDGSTAWARDRMEYQLSVATPAVSSESAPGEVVLNAPSYQGTLDWYSFDRLDPAAKASLGAAGSSTWIPSPTGKLTLIPTPVSYPGMPSSRFWEMEDTRIDFGAVDVPAGDLARLVLVEFALVYGNDWFVVPVDLPVGGVYRVASLDVTDTFGITTTIPAASAGPAGGPYFRMFRLTTQGHDAASDLLFLPPVLATSLSSRPVEEVRFLRDEGANLFWALERVVESPSGQPLDRYRASAPLPAPTATTPTYRFMAGPPDYWIPLFPSTTTPPLRLTPGAALRDGVFTPFAPQGRVLDKALSLYAEEIPREGLEVTRTYQYTRWIDGSTHLWAGRNRRPGSGEGSSGVRFDFVDPLPSATR